MKKSILALGVALSLIACKDKTESKETPISDTVENQEATQQTYAEISVAEGGEWVDGPRGHEEYANGTSFKNVNSLQLPKQHTDHTWFIRYEGPGWENSQVGYRLYLDWRNAIDIFGKKTDSMVLPQVGQDGFDSYHEPSAWGQDILKAGKSMGIGGYGRVVSDTVVHFQKVENTVAKIENSSESSSVNITYTGWKSGSDVIDLNSKLTIYPQDRFTKAELSPSKAIEGLCTGIVNHDVAFFKKEGQQWAYIATYGTQTLASPPDNLGMALFYKKNEVANQNTGKDDHLVVFKPTTETLTYYFLAAWEQEPNGITNQEDFIKDMDQKLEQLDRSNAL